MRRKWHVSEPVAGVKENLRDDAGDKQVALLRAVIERLPHWERVLRGSEVLTFWTQIVAATCGARGRQGREAIKVAWQGVSRCASLTMPCIAHDGPHDSPACLTERLEVWDAVQERAKAWRPLWEDDWRHGSASEGIVFRGKRELVALGIEGTVLAMAAMSLSVVMLSALPESEPQDVVARLVANQGKPTTSAERRVAEVTEWVWGLLEKSREEALLCAGVNAMEAGVPDEQGPLNLMAVQRLKNLDDALFGLWTVLIKRVSVSIPGQRVVGRGRYRGMAQRQAEATKEAHRRYRQRLERSAQEIGRPHLCEAAGAGAAVLGCDWRAPWFPSNRWSMRQRWRFLALLLGVVAEGWRQAAGRSEVAELLGFQGGVSHEGPRLTEAEALAQGLNVQDSLAQRKSAERRSPEQQKARHKKHDEYRLTRQREIQSKEPRR
jgi:hypothetical protein